MNLSFASPRLFQPTLHLYPQATAIYVNSLIFRPPPPFSPFPISRIPPVTRRVHFLPQDRSPIVGVFFVNFRSSPPFRCLTRSHSPRDGLRPQAFCSPWGDSLERTRIPVSPSRSAQTMVSDSLQGGHARVSSLHVPACPHLERVICTRFSRTQLSCG